MSVVFFESEELGTLCFTWRSKGHMNKGVNDLNHQQGMAEENPPTHTHTNQGPLSLPLCCQWLFCDYVNTVLMSLAPKNH